MKHEGYIERVLTDFLEADYKIKDPIVTRMLVNAMETKPLTHSENFESKCIKCDAEGCDFYYENVDQDTIHLWLNVNCPKCGANLLTESDWKVISALNLVITSKIFKAIESFFGLFNKKKVKYLMKMTGKGDVKFEDIPTN